MSSHKSMIIEVLRERMQKLIQTEGVLFEEFRMLKNEFREAHGEYAYEGPVVTNYRKLVIKVSGVAVSVALPTHITFNKDGW